LGHVERAALEARILEIPIDFDWRYFQAAPEDQRINRLQGDEWVMLENLHLRHRRLRTRLPAAVAVSRLYGAERAGVVGQVPLMPDMLHIEPDRDRCTLVWRGSCPLSDEDVIKHLTVAGGVELPNEPMLWPDTEEDLRDSAPAPASGAKVAADIVATRVMAAFEHQRAEVSGYAETLAFEDDDPMAGTHPVDSDSIPKEAQAPFEIASGSSKPGPPTTPIPGAPWSDAKTDPVPLPDENLKGTFVVPEGEGEGKK
jgi:hypothetical protein